jgi:hypothetical protein
MQRQPVESSNATSIGFEPSQRNAEVGTLEVAFKSGGIYQYKEVPQRLVNELLGAGSIGRFLHMYIIGQFDEQRVR